MTAHDLDGELLTLLNDMRATPNHRAAGSIIDAKAQILSIIEREVLAARVDELKGLLSNQYGVTYKIDGGHGFAVTVGDIQDRLESLRQQEGKL